MNGIHVVEFAGLGPAPFAAMVIAGLGASVIRIDKPWTYTLKDQISAFRAEVMNRGRRSIVLDLKSRAGLEIAKELIVKSDGLIEGFRPGVMERLGLAPEVVHELNPKLTYVRMTGWGQSGPMSQEAGHDLNYLALTGLLEAMGDPGSPSIPLNIVGDFGGGATMAVIGMIAGILSAKLGGEGSVVDAAIVDGASLLGTMFHGLTARGVWSENRASNLLDGGAPFYSIYRCADLRFVAVAALEPAFFAEFTRLIGVSEHPAFTDQMDRAKWPEMRNMLTAIFARRDSNYFDSLFRGTDGCLTKVEKLSEAPHNPQILARRGFMEVAGIVQPRPAPRFRDYEPNVSVPPFPGEHRDEIIDELGFSAQQLDAFALAGAFG